MASRERFMDRDIENIGKIIDWENRIMEKLCFLFDFLDTVNEGRANRERTGYCETYKEVINLRP